MNVGDKVGAYISVAFIVFVVRMLGINPTTSEELMYQIAISLLWVIYPIKWLLMFIVALGDALIQVIKDVF